MYKELLNTLLTQELTCELSDQIFEQLENQWPKFVSVEKKENTLRLVLDVTEDVYWFSGHFPEKAVLPGVAQVHWAVELAKCIVTGSNTFSSVSNVKFKKMIFPNESVMLTLGINDVKNTVSFTYKNKETTFSTGTVLFESQ